MNQDPYEKFSESTWDLWLVGEVDSNEVECCRKVKSGRKVLDSIGLSKNSRSLQFEL